MANGYAVALLRAMVSMQIKVYRVENLQKSREEGKKIYEFFESEQLPKDPNKYDLDNKELIVRDDELLTLTASRAFEYGIGFVHLIAVYEDPHILYLNLVAGNPYDPLYKILVALMAGERRRRRPALSRPTRALIPSRKKAP